MNNETKTVNMQESAASKKLTYEQLEQVANNLNQRCNMLYQQLQKAENAIAEYNEIGMLLDIIKQAEHFNSDFIERCTNKIEELIVKALDASEQQVEEKEPEQN